MPKKGFSFGNPKLYALRKYYHGWIERTLMTVHGLLQSSQDKQTIMQFKNCIDPIKIEDPGRLPCSRYQKSNNNCLIQNKTACLFVDIRTLIGTWWKYNEESPGLVEPLLIKLDYIIENWKQEEVIGNVKTGYLLGRVGL